MTKASTLDELEAKLLKLLDDKKNQDIETVLKITDRIVNVVKVRNRLKDDEYGSGFDKMGS